MAGAAIVTLLACSGAGAQVRNIASPESATPARGVPVPASKVAIGSEVAPAPSPSGVQPTRQSAAMQAAPNMRLISGTRSDTNINAENFSDENRVPGLGFDYAHLAAVSGSFPNNPPRFVPATPRERDFSVPIFFGGFPYYSDFSNYQQVQPQPQIIVIQQPPAPVVVQQPAPAVPESHVDAAAPVHLPDPVRDIGEFILVRRDGKILFASVFSVVSNQLQYVTPEGIRHTLPLIELDKTATQDMNEARGTTLQFHN